MLIYYYMGGACSPFSYPAPPGGREVQRMESFSEVLAAVKAYCEERLVAATYTLFIEGLEPVEFAGNEAVLSARSDFLRSIVADRYLPLLEQGFEAVLGFPVKVTVVLSDQPDIPVEEPVGKKLPENTHTFENFVVGSNNKFAHAAAQAVAANPSGAYNPLFIYGDSGLGKTHLLSAIRTEVAKNHPEYKILYVDGETFTNEIIAAIRSGSTEDFHQRYRTADLLLVDDIQFIAGKESTQEEFFHTFNSLYNANRQIVLVSDRPPKDIKSLEQRLRTRFESGLTTDIEPPDFETRIAIIRRKADSLGLELPDDVAEYIANNLKSNIRQLEGAVKKLAAYKTIEGIPPVIGLTQNIIKEIQSENLPVPVTVDKIVSEVARTYNISTADLRSRKQTASVSNGRKLAMYIVREVTGLSMEEIGKEFGDRDHSTVVYAIGDIQKKLDTDRRMRETVEDIIKNVKG